MKEEGVWRKKVLAYLLTASNIVWQVVVGGCSNQKISALYQSRETVGASIPVDIVLVVGSTRTRVAAHRVLLTLHSRFFESMFKWEFSDSNAEEVVVSLDNLLAQDEPEAFSFNRFVEYMYGRNMVVPPNKLVPLYQLADVFLVKELQRRCKTQILKVVKSCGGFEILEQLFRLVSPIAPC